MVKNLVITRSGKKISSLRNRLKVVQGGTSAGKTYAILQLWILNALHGNEKFKGVNSIVSESLPHLKRGALRDFLEILNNIGYYNIKDHNRTNNTYTLNGCVFEFFPADDASKLRGGRRLNLFINEANNVTKLAYDELEVRTKHNIWIDYNPVADFYGMHLGEDPLVLTYSDNQMLDNNIRQSIESRKNNEQWFRVYGLGLVGTLEGQIYKNWEVIDKIPEDAERLGSGLDFGFSQDPTAVVTVYRYDSELIINEVLYRKGMTNSEIALFLKDQTTGMIYADSAEPKSIHEIQSYGIQIRGARKGKDSVIFGINLLQDYKLRPTKTSVNLIKALRNYSWTKNKDGEYINKPNHAFSDVLDALRYFGIMTLNKSEGVYAIA